MEPAELEKFLAMIPTLPVEKQVKLFIKTRAAKAAGQKVWDGQEAEFKKIMECCQNHMLKKAIADGVTGFTTPFGTTYTAINTKISIADDEAFFNFVRAEGDLDFFERRVSSTHVNAYMQKLVTAAELQGLPKEEAAKAAVPPPGLNIFRETEMRVRKANEK